MPHLDVQSVGDQRQPRQQQRRDRSGRADQADGDPDQSVAQRSKNITRRSPCSRRRRPASPSCNTRTYGAIAAQGTLAGTPFLIIGRRRCLCGQSLDFTLAITSQPGNVVTSATFKIRVGTARERTRRSPTRERSPAVSRSPTTTCAASRPSGDHRRLRDHRHQLPRRQPDAYLGRRLDGGPQGSERIRRDLIFHPRVYYDCSAIPATTSSIW